MNEFIELMTFIFIWMLIGAGIGVVSVFLGHFIGTGWEWLMRQLKRNE